MKKTIPGSLVLALASTPVYAHIGHAGHGFLAGFAHPFTGADHLLVMLCLGLWAGKIGGATRWQLPLAFMLIMAISAVSGMVLLSSSVLEIGIAASVMAIGLLLAMRLSVNSAAQFAIVGLFAILHGLAHGAELDLAGGMSVISGMVLATGLLHAAGLWLASQSLKISQQFYAFLGWMVVLVGGSMLLAAT